MANREILIHNAVVVQKDRVVEGGAVALRGQKIVAVLDDPRQLRFHPDAEMVDAGGAYVLPGFIDTHSDNIERVIQPRPQSVIDFELAMREQEKQLVNQGITTMYHSLSTTDVRGKSSIRSPENLKKLAALIKSFHEGESIIHHRFHCRYDMCNLAGYDMLIDFIRGGDIHYLSFTDHTPGQGQYRDIEFFKSHVLPAYHGTDTNVDELLSERMSREKLTDAQVRAAADLACACGIPIASHDDDTLEKLAYVTEKLHSNISEFPVDMEIAKAARARDMLVVVGAPNVLMGRSHSNNLSAIEAVRAGCADILVSDYFPPAILHAVFKLFGEGLLPLPDAVNMASYNPARAMRVDDRIGSIEAGKNADLLIVSKKGALPVVTSVFIDGALVSSLRYRDAQVKEGRAINV